MSRLNMLVLIAFTWCGCSQPTASDQAERYLEENPNGPRRDWMRERAPSGPSR